MENKSKKGFGSLSPERLHEVAIQGGKAAQATGRAHRFAAGKEAKDDGRRGGKAKWKRYNEGSHIESSIMV